MPPQALQAWLWRGLNATVLLLQTEGYVPVASVLNRVATVALSAGAAVGLSWQQGGQADGSSGAVVGAGSAEELEALLHMSAEPDGSSAGGAAGAAQPWVTTLHVLSPASGGGGSLAALNVVAVPRGEQALVLRLLKELLGLHRQGRAGGQLALYERTPLDCLYCLRLCRHSVRCNIGRGLPGASHPSVDALPSLPQASFPWLAPSCRPSLQRWHRWWPGPCSWR